MLYSHNGEYPEKLPDRIRLSDGSTRTDKRTFTSEEIADAGYVLAPLPLVETNYDEKIEWSAGEWIKVKYTEEELTSVMNDRRKSLNDHFLKEISYYKNMLNPIQAGEQEANQSETLSEEQINRINQYIAECEAIIDVENPFTVIKPSLEL